MAKDEKVLSFKDKLQKLKQTQESRRNETYPVYVEEWDEEFQVKRLSSEDHHTAKAFAKKNFPNKFDEAVEAAFVCIAVDGKLELNPDNVSFLMKEPAPVLAPLKGKILSVSGLER